MASRKPTLAEDSAGFRLLFANNPLPMWVYDVVSLAFVEVNEAAVVQYGYTRGEFLAMRITDIRPVEDVPRLLDDVAGFRPALQSSGEWRHRKKDGQIIDVHIVSHTLEFAGRNAALVVAQDITERKRAERALSKSEAHKTAIVQSALDCIITVDHAGRILEFNPAAEATFGHRRDEVLGRELGELIVLPGLRDPHRGGLAHYLAAGGGSILGRRIETTALRATGEEFPVELAVARDPSADPPVFIGFARDIGPRKQAEEVLQESGRRYRTLFDGAPVGLLRTTADGKILDANPVFVEMLAFPDRETLLATNITELYVDLEDRNAALRRADRQGTYGGVEMRLRRYDGGEVWVRSNARLIRDASGNPVHYEGGALDITEEKRAEAILQRLAAIVESSDDAILSKTLDGIILSWNAGAERVYGYTAEDVIGRPVSLLVPPDRSDEVPEILGRLKRGERVEHFETVRMRHDGTRIDVALTISPIRDTMGNVIGASTIARDITERKRAEREVLTLNQELEDRVQRRTAELQTANQELEAFAYSIAHDLRAPLITISGFSRMIIEDHAATLSPDAQQSLERIAGSAGQMDALIRDLLAFSQLSRQAMNEQAVAPADVARQVLADLRTPESPSPATVVIGDLPTCRVDPALLKQVFANLLTNALKFSRTRADAVIEVGWRTDLDDSGYHTYFVKDNGAGFDMQYVEMLFRVFQRLHRVEEYEGTGVGLAIVARIVRRHGGRVWAEGEVGKGATFYFTLPKGGAA